MPHTACFAHHRLPPAALCVLWCVGRVHAASGTDWVLALVLSSRLGRTKSCCRVVRVCFPPAPLPLPLPSPSHSQYNSAQYNAVIIVLATELHWKQNQTRQRTQ
jgi:hypothetical protein